MSVLSSSPDKGEAYRDRVDQGRYLDPWGVASLTCSGTDKSKHQAGVCGSSLAVESA